MGNFIEIVTEEEKATYVAGDTKIFYRRLDPSKTRATQNKWTRPDGINKRTGDKKTKIDEENWYKDMLDYIIVGWEGVIYPAGTSKSGQEVPCNRDTKFMLPSRVREEIWELAESDTAGRADSAEEEKKTLKNT